MRSEVRQRDIEKSDRGILRLFLQNKVIRSNGSEVRMVGKVTPIFLLSSPPSPPYPPSESPFPPLLILKSSNTFLYPITFYCLLFYHISYRTIPYSIISYHIIPYFITYHIISYHTIFYHIPYHIIPYFIISYHIISY